VQVPAQPLLAAAALVDEVVAVIDEQLQLAQQLFAGARPLDTRLLERSRARSRLTCRVSG
jgi:hypothetical protein